MTAIPLPWVPEGHQPRALFATGSGPSLDWDGSGRVLRVALPSAMAVLIAFRAAGTGH